MAYLTKNNAKTTLLGSISNSVLALTIPIADVGKFPSTGTFIATIWPSTGSPVNGEIIEVTAVASNVWTIVRAFEPIAGASVAQAWPSGSIIEMLVTAGVMAQFTEANTLLGYIPVTVSTPSEIPVLTASGTLPAATVDGSSLTTSAIFLGYAEISSTFNSTASVADVPGVSVTVTVPTGGRRIKITVHPAYVKTTGAAGTTVSLDIREGSTVLQQSLVDQPVSGYACFLETIYSGVATAGSHTYKATIEQTAAGTMTFGATGTQGTGFILVELD